MLEFEYVNAKGERSKRAVDVVFSDGRGLTGYCSLSDAIKSFRFDRMANVVNLDTGEIFPTGYEYCKKVLGLEPEAIPEARPKKQAKPQILFTGFPASEKAELENKAKAAGFSVCKSVTKNLAVLCIGSNAGPSKIKKAGKCGAEIMDEEGLDVLFKED